MTFDIGPEGLPESKPEQTHKPHQLNADNRETGLTSSDGHGERKDNIGWPIEEEPAGPESEPEKITSEGRGWLKGLGVDLTVGAHTDIAFGAHKGENSDGSPQEEKTSTEPEDSDKPDQEHDSPAIPQAGDETGDGGGGEPPESGPLMEPENPDQPLRFKDITLEVDGHGWDLNPLGPVVSSRVYPGSTEIRGSVPPELVPWEVDFPGYRPTTVDLPGRATIDQAYNDPAPDDPNVGGDVVSLETGEEVLRDSQGRMLNPIGRTGFDGLGDYDYPGPNKSVIYILTMDIGGSASVFMETNPETKQRSILPERLIKKGKTADQTSNELRDNISEDLSHPDQGTTTRIFKGYAGKLKNTDFAWGEAYVDHQHLPNGHTTEPGALESREAGWTTINHVLASSQIDPHQRRMLEIIAERLYFKAAQPKMPDSTIRSNFIEQVFIEEYEIKDTITSETSGGGRVELPYTTPYERVVSRTSGPAPTETTRFKSERSLETLPDEAKRSLEMAKWIEEDNLLRKPIEPKHHRLVVSEHGGGYLFAVKPDADALRTFGRSSRAGRDIDVRELISIRGVQKIGEGYVVLPVRHLDFDNIHYKDPEINFFAPEGSNAFWFSGSPQYITSDNDPDLLDKHGLPRYLIVPTVFCNIETIEAKEY